MGVVCSPNGDTGEQERIVFKFFFKATLKRRAPLPQVASDNQKFIKAALENAMSLQRAPQFCAEPFVSRKVGTSAVMSICYQVGGGDAGSIPCSEIL